MTGVPNIDVRGKRIVPVLFVGKEDCCGCSACKAICPVHAIRMLADEEGFLYPSIDASECIGCHRCLAICPMKQTGE